MLLLAQTDPAGVARLFDQYGVSLMIVVVGIIGMGYALYRLLARNGILTTHFKKDSDNHEHLVESVRIMSRTGEKISEVMVSTDKRLKAIEDSAGRVEMMHYDVHSRFATTTLGRCFLNACDVAEHIIDRMDSTDADAPDLGPFCKPLIDDMRNQLRDHLAIAEHLPPKGNQNEVFGPS